MVSVMNLSAAKLNGRLFVFVTRDVFGAFLDQSKLSLWVNTWYTIGGKTLRTTLTF